jgi:hypothetical protein
MNLTAFEKWFQQAYKDDPMSGAHYLYYCCTTGPRDSVAWSWLEKVGDKSYTADTFIKAAKLILEAK